MSHFYARVVLFALSILSWASVTAAQDLTIPSTWLVRELKQHVYVGSSQASQNPTSNISRESRESLANSAAAALLAQVNPAGGVSDGTSPRSQEALRTHLSYLDLPNVQDITGVFSVLALQDYYSGNSTWKDFVSSGIQAYYQQHGLYGGLPDLNNDAIYWGLGFYYAYRTYKAQFLLDLAETAYNTTYADGFITPSAASSGSGAGRNVSFSPPSGCTSSKSPQVLRFQMLISATVNQRPSLAECSGCAC